MKQENRTFLCEGVFWDARQGGRQFEPASGYRGLLRLSDDLQTSCNFEFPDPIAFGVLNQFFVTPMFFAHVQDALHVGETYFICEGKKSVGRLKVLS